MAEPITNVASGQGCRRSLHRLSRQEPGEDHLQDQEVQCQGCLSHLQDSSFLLTHDHHLAKVIELCKDLTATAERSYNERTPKGSGGEDGYNHGSQAKNGGGGSCGAGKEHGKEHGKDKDNNSRVGRGKDSLRGGKAPTRVKN